MQPSTISCDDGKLSMRVGGLPAARFNQDLENRYQALLDEPQLVWMESHRVLRRLGSGGQGIVFSQVDVHRSGGDWDWTEDRGLRTEGRRCGGLGVEQFRRRVAENVRLSLTHQFCAESVDYLKAALQIAQRHRKG